MTRGRARAALAVAVVAALAAPAAAHQSAVKYLDLDVRGATVTAELRFQPSDVTRPLGLADDATPDVDQALAGAAKVVPYVAEWIAVRAGDVACPPSAPVLDRAAADPRFLALRWTSRCPREVERLVLDLARFFVVDRTHEVVLHLTSPDADPYDTTIAIGDNPVSLALGEAGPTTAPGWIWRGVIEAYTGPTHVAVVLALVLVAVIARRRANGGDAWAVRPAAPVVQTAIAVLGAFALGHTASLVAWARDLVALPDAFAGAMIGLTIVYVAVEDALAPDVRWRPALALGFGLVHGIGLAVAFAPILPPDPGPVPILELDLGVIAGELSIAAVALPTLAVLARVVGAGRYRRLWMPALAAALAVLGAAWFVDHVM